MDTTSARPAASPTNEGVKTPQLSDKPGTKTPAAEPAADSAAQRTGAAAGADAATTKTGGDNKDAGA